MVVDSFSDRYGLVTVFPAMLPVTPSSEMRWERSIPCTRRRKFVHMLDVIAFEPRKDLGGNFGIIM